MRIKAERLRFTLCLLSAISVAVSSILFVPSASAIGALYNSSTGNGDVACGTAGYFTIANNVVTTRNGCQGAVVIPNGVTSIGIFAFWSDTSITSVVISNTVNSISDSAFSGATSLTSLTIGSNVTSIGNFAFYRTTSLVSLIIPNSVRTIGNSAFSESTSLTSVTIGDGLSSIENYAFSNATSLNSLTIGNGVTSIGDYAFENAISLTSLTIPDRVTSIGNMAFYNATSIASLNIGRGVITIGTGAFGRLSSLTSLTIPDNVTTLGNFAFLLATSMTSLTIGNGVTSIGNNAFQGADSLVSLIIGNSVTSIGNYAFHTAESLTSLTIGNSVRTIGNGAFLDARSLTTLTIAGNVTSIGNDAFLRATSLTSLTIGDGVTSIGTSAFSNASSLTALTIGKGVTSIGRFAFSFANSLSSYNYCGTYLSNQDFVTADLGDKRRLSCLSAPGAPTISAATAIGKRSATISFSAPASSGGSTITSYTATSIPGGISKTLTQSDGGTFTIDGLQPGTSYTFAVTATNNIGTSVVATSNSIRTIAADVASISSLSFSDDGSGTSGKLVWAGKNIESVLYTGPTSSYPGPFNYGAFTSGWNGTIRNLTPETSYTVSIHAVSIDGVGESKSLTFKTGTKTDVVKNLAYWRSWLPNNTFLPNEAISLMGLLNKFDALVTSPHRSYIKVPLSSVSKVVAISLTPKSCSVVSATAKVDAGLVKAITKETCTISYTVSGPSKAPATLFKDFVFNKVG